MPNNLTIFSAMNNMFRSKSAGGYMPSMPSNMWWPFSVKEPFTGAWQSNIEWKRDTVLAYHAVFACITLIAGDISKLRMTYKRKDSNDIWQEIPLGKFDVLDQPNAYQNRIQFFESWLNSKLIRGNAYILLERARDLSIKAMYVLNPDLVYPLVTPEGEVFYQLGIDNLANVTEAQYTVPAEDIIHDRFNCLCHPLIGLSPLFASGLAAFSGLKMQANAAHSFQNMSRPSGILTTPGAIDQAKAQIIKEGWEANYSKDNYGRVAVLGDDLKYEPLSMTAVESELVQLMNLTAEIVCSTFHVPKYKVIGDPPTVNNIEALEQNYYSQCLQTLIESIELLLDEKLNVPASTGFEFDLDGLLRMDTKTQIETLTMAIKGGLDTPNEARKKRNQKPLDGGNTVWLQQQQWPMEILAQRRNPPIDSPAPATPDAPPADDTGDANAKFMDDFLGAVTKEMESFSV